MADLDVKKKAAPKTKNKWKKRPSNKPSANEQVLTKLREIISTPKGEWTENDDDVKVSFYRSRVGGPVLNFENNPYAGINAMLLNEGMDAADKNVGCFATGKQINDYFEKNKGKLPKGNEIFDPEKPLKGLKAVSPIYKWNKSYYQNGKSINDEETIKKLDFLSKKELEQQNITKYIGMKYLTSVFALEDLKEQFPESFIKERPYFAKAEELAALRMNPEKESKHFCDMAEIIIKASGVEVIEKSDSNRAYFSPSENHVVIPTRDRFDSDEARLAVILHELSHATGHSSRLNREFAGKTIDGKKNKNYDIQYASEEIIAETSTAFLTARFGLKSFNAHAKYIKGYCDTVCANNNDKVLMSLSTKAMAAANYLGDKVDTYLLQLELENKLKQENKVVIDSDLKEGKLILEGTLLIQTVHLSKNESKSFKIAIDIDKKDKVEVDDLRMFEEYKKGKGRSANTKDLEDSIKADFKALLINKYELNQKELKEQEEQRKTVKQEVIVAETPKNKKDKPKLSM